MNGVNEFLDSLTEKQLDVLSCVIFGLSYKSIGRTLGISDRTVGVHIHEILQKAGISTKDELVKCLNLPTNTVHYNKLKNRYHLIVSGITPQRKSNVPWKVCMVIPVVILILEVIAYYFSVENTEVSLQSMGSSTYILKRKNIIRQMNSCKDHIIVLVGQGGAGKTALAREYIKNLNVSIKYEIDTETNDTLASDIFGLAGILAKTQKDIETKNIMESISNERERFRSISIFLHRKLKEERNWCLFLDNLDNINVVLSSYLDNLFNLTNGMIVITTRNKNVQGYLPDAKVIQIGELSEKEKMELFCEITNQHSSKVIKENLQKIPSYPLDVSCCAYYVRNTGISLPSYVQKMSRMDQSFWSENLSILSDSTNYSKSRCSIILSSIKNILRQDTNFQRAKLLLAISILDSRKISSDLLSKITEATFLGERIYEIQKYGLAELDGHNNFSVHRVTQTIIRHYCLQHIPKDKLKKFISEICDAICEDKNDDSMIPHMNSIILNLEENLQSEDRIKIQIALINLIKQYGSSPMEAVKHIKDVIKTGKAVLDSHEIVDLQLDGAKLCISAGKDKEAVEFLENDLKSLPFKRSYLLSYINYYTLWGIIYARRHLFEKASNNFNIAVGLLEETKEDPNLKKIAEAAIYSRGINYIMCYIYKHQKHKVLNLIKYISDLIDGADLRESSYALANIRIRLATMYNSLGMHDESLQMCEESKHLLEKTEKRNTGYYSTKGLIYLELGHAYLRKNNLDKSEYYLHKAREIFDQLMRYEHFSRVYIQEAEIFARTGKYEKAYQNCMNVITNKKSDSDFHELFLNKAHYIAGDVQYKLGNYRQALKHFCDFTVGIKSFCKYFLSEQEFRALDSMHVFDVISSEEKLKMCFKNAVEIFKKISGDDSKFVADYALKNLEEFN